MNKINNINYNCTISLPFLLILMFFNGELFSVYACLVPDIILYYFILFTFEPYMVFRYSGLSLFCSFGLRERYIFIWN
jgi:hypothetical protein